MSVAGVFGTFLKAGTEDGGHVPTMGNPMTKSDMSDVSGHSMAWRSASSSAKCTFPATERTDGDT